MKQLENTVTREIFNEEEIDKLQQFISQLEKPEGPSYFAQTGKYSQALSASRISTQALGS